MRAAAKVSVATGGAADSSCCSCCEKVYEVRKWKDELVSLITRPPRRKYTVDSLGPELCDVGPQKIACRRTDFDVTGTAGLLQCSHWVPIAAAAALASTGKKLPCVVYLHGNSGSRLDCFSGPLDQVIGNPAETGGAMSLVAFDFGGCGLSEGEYISLGSERPRGTLTTTPGGRPSAAVRIAAC